MSESRNMDDYFFDLAPAFICLTSVSIVPDEVFDRITKNTMNPIATAIRRIAARILVMLSCLTDMIYSLLGRLSMLCMPQLCTSLAGKVLSKVLVNRNHLAWPSTNE